MGKPDFIYTIYIKAKPEAVWDALRDPELTRLFWGWHRNASDWRPGARWEHQDYDDPQAVHVAGEVVVFDPPRRLVLTWGPPDAAAGDDRVSRVTFELKPFEDAVRLTVRHEELDPATLQGISAGWPAILSSLKSLLETGTPLASTTRRWAG
ncbi:SRPBCC family protein [Marinibaculum pumilum]|uniref:SRPBCC family protein n=1 Tax=Marinibaculum pumilum TaxID=1766165 RepID=A0ABV7L863_9PROT